MEKINQNTSTTLQELTFILDDGRVGFHNAAVYVESPDLKESFLEYSRERNFYIEQLQDALRKAVPEVDYSQDTLVSWQRTWTDLEPVLVTGDEDEIIDACIRGEEAVISKFKSALELNGLSNSIRNIIENQLSEIKKTVSIIKIKKLVL